MNFTRYLSLIFLTSRSISNNPFFNEHEPGVIPHFVAEQNATVIIAGGMGPKAIEWFEKLNVKPITTKPRKIKDILNDYIEGRLSEAEPCNGYKH